MRMLAALASLHWAAAAAAAAAEGCVASDDNLVLLRNTLCQSIGAFPGFPHCRLGPGGASGPKPGNLTAEGDWPNQAVYMYDLLVFLLGTAAPPPSTPARPSKRTCAEIIALSR